MTETDMRTAHLSLVWTPTVLLFSDKINHRELRHTGVQFCADLPERTHSSTALSNKGIALHPAVSPCRSYTWRLLSDSEQKTHTSWRNSDYLYVTKKAVTNFKAAGINKTSNRSEQAASRLPNVPHTSVHVWLSIHFQRSKNEQQRNCFQCHKVINHRANHW